MAKSKRKKQKQLPPELAHDDREIDARAIRRFSAVLAACVVVAMGAMWSFDRWLTEGERSQHEPPPPMASALPTAPPEPKLQAAPREGLARLRAEEKAQLESYGWIDRDKGIVQIPIDRAIELLSRRRLPARRQGPPAVSPVSRPNESGTGIQRQAKRRRLKR